MSGIPRGITLEKMFEISVVDRVISFSTFWKQLMHLFYAHNSMIMIVYFKTPFEINKNE